MLNSQNTVVAFRPSDNMKIAEDPTQSWCVQEAEIPSIASWLGPRLAERWPHVTEDTIAATMRFAINSRQQYLVRSKTAVGLAEIYRTQLDRRPLVFEVFVRGVKGTNGAIAKGDLVIVHQAIVRWAENAKAREIIMARDTDLPAADLYEIHRSLKKRHYGSMILEAS